MKNKINVLVTGSGGDIGQSVFKCLKEISFIGNIIGTDISLATASIFLCDKMVEVPKCNESKYLDELKQVVKTNEIGIIIPISEAEISFFFTNKLFKIHSAKLIMPNVKSLRIGSDKLKTSLFLKNNNLSYPKTFLVNESFELQYPFIVKSRFGNGGKELFIVESTKQLSLIKNNYPGHIAQELIGNDQNEYTCGLFRSSKKEIRTIIFKRQLTGGFSSFGEVINSPIIEEYLNKIAEVLDLNGSINIQLRLSNFQPKVFEINPRFSSTVRFRYLLGFEDVKWVLEDELGLNISNYTSVKEGRKFYKGYNEFIN